MKRVRVLIGAVTKIGTLSPGAIMHIEDDLAEKLLASGIVMEDKSTEPPELKVNSPGGEDPEGFPEPSKVVVPLRPPGFLRRRKSHHSRKARR